MALAKDTHVTDEIVPKNGARVVYLFKHGYGTAVSLGMIDQDDFATRRMLEALPTSSEVTLPITTNPQTYTYLGGLAFPDIRFSQIQADGLRHPAFNDWSYDPGTGVITFALEPADQNIAYIR